jgi:hypothetical protein
MLFIYYSGVQDDFHITSCSRRLTVTRRLPQVEQELLTITKYISSPLLFSQSFAFCVELCISLYVLCNYPLLVIGYSSNILLFYIFSVVSSWGMYAFVHTDHCKLPLTASLRCISMLRLVFGISLFPHWTHNPFHNTYPKKIHQKICRRAEY